ncbi:alanine racemase [Sphingomonas ginkgonis]|uniref:alanine racemase n=1 Tax=Sphingomonas ginkgonis TaxID=2315330 RepID=A0A429VCV8_9SPHN|nr:alanine racemase [Sphingomonas ginkgonis]RST31763.1 alanine racemase [Sphingomonas ginkgonis]
MHRPLRLDLDSTALVANWRWLAERAGVPAGAAVKADGYGLGARAVVERLGAAGCRDFFVSTWWEAEQLGTLPDGASLVVLHGIGPDDLAAALASPARPCLNTPEQVARWKQAAPGRPCDVMIDTGMNRLGLRQEEAGLLDGLIIDTLHSHLACADEDHPLNAAQLARFRDAAASTPAKRHALANSAGTCLGRDYSFDLVRPGLALYGGLPREEAAGAIRPVARLQAQVVQRRSVRAGESCGYGATFVADRDLKAAVVNIGYADGYFRGFSSVGTARAGDTVLPLLGRVSMDLLIFATAGADVGEGDWLTIDFDLPQAAERSGMSQYELLTGLGSRFDRRWS